MSEGVVAAIQAISPQIIAVASGALFFALLIGLVVGIRMRKQMITQVAEEILATSQFATAAKVEGEKHLRSVGFQEAVQRTVKDDARTQSGIIAIVITSTAVQEFIDRRIDHRNISHDMVMDLKIRESQEHMRREVKEAMDRIEDQLGKIADTFMSHIQGGQKQ